MSRSYKLYATLLFWSIASTIAYPSSQEPLRSSFNQEAVDQLSLCPQVLPLIPSKHAKLDTALDQLHNQNAFQQRAIEALGGAIRIPTESYDDLGPVGEDPRWDTFALLHSYLEDTFPHVYQALDVTRVNTHGLVFHWEGSDDTHLPVLITGHQDVVPVEPNTIDKWIHPPYSGYYDGTWIWGRGAVDDKSDVISILVTVDSLLKARFKPTRTFVFAFGFDEEASSYEGAGHLHTYLEDRYGRGSFAALLDEGGGFGSMSGDDVIFATPCTGEKGYLDVRLAVSTLGGHSSVPPPHTGIGILAAAIVELESHPHPTSLTRNGTTFEFLECCAAYGPAIPEAIKTLIKLAKTDDDALDQLPELLLQLDPNFAALLGTTQAVDIIHGGVKINALPESVEAIVNHRVAEHSSVSALQQRITEVLLPIAVAFDLSLDAFGVNITAGSGKGGRMSMSDAWGTAIEPAPKTPTDSSEPWNVLSGTIKAALERSPAYGNRTVVVTPTLAVGNTDTRWYWNLTKHIYRYSHTADEGVYNGVHTVNEAISRDAFIDKIRFHAKFILNWDESTL